MYQISVSVVSFPFPVKGSFRVSATCENSKFIFIGHRNQEYNCVVLPSNSLGWIAMKVCTQKLNVTLQYKCNICFIYSFRSLWLFYFYNNHFGMSNFRISLNYIIVTILLTIFEHWFHFPFLSYFFVSPVLFGSRTSTFAIVILVYTYSSTWLVISIPMHCFLHTNHSPDCTTQVTQGVIATLTTFCRGRCNRF